MSPELREFIIGYACLCLGLLFAFALSEYLYYPHSVIDYKKYYNSAKYYLTYLWLKATMKPRNAKIIRFPVERIKRGTKSN